MLERSPTPGAEEWAIHDHEVGPLRLGEYEDLATISQIGHGIAEHGPAFAHWTAICGTSDRETQRRYIERLTRQRMHQPVFRIRVLTAYANQCAMCQLRYSSLLDAAHILPDGHPRGAPIVPNGLSLCKIHHAAYDENLLGVRPDLVVEVRSDVSRQIDGPMLLHGLQEMAGTRLTRPRARAAQPDPERLEERYEEFRRAG
jgi:putative restriction endonuclease